MAQSLPTATQGCHVPASDGAITLGGSTAGRNATSGVALGRRTPALAEPCHDVGTGPPCFTVSRTPCISDAATDVVPCPAPYFGSVPP